MKPPCYKCQEREIGCHAHCEDYLAYKAVMEEARQKRLNELGLKGMTVEHHDRNVKFRMRCGSHNNAGK